jgi:hypothetical protein
MNPQYAAAQLLYKIVGGVIPQSAKEQGMPVQAQHKQIALVSLYTFHDRLHFVPFNKFRRQTYTLHLSGLHEPEGLGSNWPPADVAAQSLPGPLHRCTQRMEEDFPALIPP